MHAARVTNLALTAIKGTRLRQVDEIDLSRDGALGDRRFLLIDDRGRMVNGKISGALQTVGSSYDERSERLTLTLADGSVVEERIQVGERVDANMFGELRAARLVHGPWAAALSELTGRELRLLQAGSAVDRGRKGAVSLMSQASLRRLAAQADADSVDGRRFRMLIEVDRIEAHAEDMWVGHAARIGGALVLFEGHVGRCRVTSLDPDSGEPNLQTLDLLRGYREGLDTTEPLAFGIFGQVVQDGHVSIGDAVTI